MDDDIVDLTASESTLRIAPSSVPQKNCLDSQRRADDIKRKISEKKKEVETARNTYRRLSQELKDLEISLESIQSAASRLKTDWAGRFDWSDKVEALMRHPFKLAEFRPLQLEIINAALSGRDVLVVLPTGGLIAFSFGVWHFEV
jgi:predicted nuclease with TOPRIM domain